MSVDEESDYTCIRYVKQTVHIVLPPSYIGNEKKGVIDILNNWKTQYVRSLEGIVIGFDNVTFVQREGSIITDQPFVHHDVEANFQVFKPVIGSIMKGVINRVSQEHIGCLVHDCINVSIHLSSSVLPELSSYIGIGETVFFKITNVDINRRIIRIRGEISEECVPLMQKTFPDAPEHNYLKGELIEDYHTDHEDALTAPNDYSAIKESDFINTAIEDQTNLEKFNYSSPLKKHKRWDDDTQRSSSTDSAVRKKKRKKHDLNNSLDTNTDSSVCKKKRKKRHSKDSHSTSTDSVRSKKRKGHNLKESHDSNTDSSPRKKRKKHLKDSHFSNADSSTRKIKREKHDG